MKKVLFLVVIFCALKINAQNYQIRFAGTGASSEVITVKVENLTIGGTPLILQGNDILHLTGSTGINPAENVQSLKLKVFPNPATGNSKLLIDPPCSGNAIIAVLDITGKQIAGIQSFLDNSVQEFQLSGLNKGFYLISVKGNTYHYSGRLLSNSLTGGKIIISHISSSQTFDEKEPDRDIKGSFTTIDMVYSAGDIMKFTGTSGNYSTVKTEIPEEDKTITFNFIACTDGDNNNYPVVEIHGQKWMAENLKTTKYSDGSEIQVITDNTAWKNLTTGACCDYENNSGNVTTYGKLYNWPAAVDSRNICPTGWHVPEKDDWGTLNNNLGDGMIAGSKLKETGTGHWNSPNTDATNETGFTSLPGGSRSGIDGTFKNINSSGYWQSKTPVDELNSYGAGMSYNYGWLATVKGIKQNGFSVRCLKD